MAEYRDPFEGMSALKRIGLGFALGGRGVGEVQAEARKRFEEEQQRQQQSALQELFVKGQPAAVSHPSAVSQPTTQMPSSLQRLGEAARIDAKFQVPYMSALSKWEEEQRKPQPIVPEGVKIPEGYTPVKDVYSPSGFKLEPIAGYTIPSKEDEEIKKLERERQFKLKVEKEDKAIQVKADRPTLDKSYRTLTQGITDLDSYIDEAIEKSNKWSTGMGAETMSFVGGTEASELATVLERIQSSTVIDTISKMKAESKTGATGFGSLSAPELTLLKNSIIALSQSQTEKEFDKNLRKLKKYNSRLKKNFVDDYRNIYGSEPELKDGVNDGGMSDDELMKALGL